MISELRQGIAPMTIERTCDRRKIAILAGVAIRAA